MQLMLFEAGFCEDESWFTDCAGLVSISRATEGSMNHP